MTDYIQRDFVRDYVFPLAKAKIINKQIIFEEFLGTSFLIGNRGFALTASHLIKDVDGLIAGMFANEKGNWVAFLIEDSEEHNVTDVTIIKLKGGSWTSPFIITEKKHFGWKDYMLCGYPEMVIFEDRRNININGKVLPRPDLISIKGHIRRRIPRNIDIPNIKGQMFYELSSIAGWGCSGAPIFNVLPNKKWEVIGLYSAQKIFYSENKDDNNIKFIDYGVGYAVTSDFIANWQPNILGLSIKEESEKIN